MLSFTHTKCPFRPQAQRLPQNLGLKYMSLNEILKKATCKKKRRRSFIGCKDCIIHLSIPLQSRSAAGIYGSHAVSTVHTALQSNKRESSECHQHILLRQILPDAGKLTISTNVFSPRRQVCSEQHGGTCCIRKCK